MIKIESKNSQNKTENLEYVEPEIWKDIKGFDGWYQVSSLGRIKTFRVGGRYTEGLRSKGKIMKPAPDVDGYPIAHLVKGDKSIFQKVHRIVAKHFIDNPEGKKIVNHLNGKKDDNRVVNLAWSTHSENQRHAVELGLKPKSTKLNPEDVLEMRRLYDSGEKTIKEITDMYPVSYATVGRAVKRVSWKWVK